MNSSNNKKDRGERSSHYSQDFFSSSTKSPSKAPSSPFTPKAFGFDFMKSSNDKEDVFEEPNDENNQNHNSNAAHFFKDSPRFDYATDNFVHEKRGCFSPKRTPRNTPKSSSNQKIGCFTGRKKCVLNHKDESNSIMKPESDLNIATMTLSNSNNSSDSLGTPPENKAALWGEFMSFMGGDNAVPQEIIIEGSQKKKLFRNRPHVRKTKHGKKKYASLEYV